MIVPVLYKNSTQQPGGTAIPLTNLLRSYLGLGDITIIGSLAHFRQDITLYTICFVNFHFGIKVKDLKTYSIH